MFYCIFKSLYVEQSVYSAICPIGLLNTRESCAPPPRSEVRACRGGGGECVQQYPLRPVQTENLFRVVGSLGPFFRVLARDQYDPVSVEAAREDNPVVARHVTANIVHKIVPKGSFVRVQSLESVSRTNFPGEVGARIKPRSQFRR